MIQIPLSQSGPAQAFAAAVEAFRAALEKHAIGKPGIHAPIAPSILVDGLVQRVPDTGPVAQRGPDRFVIADYEIVDDTPPEAPPPTLEQRKMLLTADLHAAAAAAKAALLSPARSQLLMLDAHAAMAKPEVVRSAGESAAIEAYSAFVGRCAEIDRAALLAAIEVEDLTNSTVDVWIPTKF